MANKRILGLDAAVTSNDDYYIACEKTGDAESKKKPLSDIIYVPDPTFIEKIVEIGDWDMEDTTFKAVTHGVTDYKTIRSVDVIVRNDADDLYYPLDKANIGSLDGGITEIGSTDINLQVTTAGFFRTADFNSTSYNRGWITIRYTS